MLVGTRFRKGGKGENPDQAFPTGKQYLQGNRGTPLEDTLEAYRLSPEPKMNIINLGRVSAAYLSAAIK